MTLPHNSARMTLLGLLAPVISALPSPTPSPAASLYFRALVNSLLCHHPSQLAFLSISLIVSRLMFCKHYLQNAQENPQNVLYFKRIFWQVHKLTLESLVFLVPINNPQSIGKSTGLDWSSWFPLLLPCPVGLVQVTMATTDYNSYRMKAAHALTRSPCLSSAQSSSVASHFMFLRISLIPPPLFLSSSSFWDL